MKPLKVAPAIIKHSFGSDKQYEGTKNDIFDSKNKIIKPNTLFST